MQSSWGYNVRISKPVVLFDSEPDSDSDPDFNIFNKP
jgi:hypothetical protein